MKKFTLIPSLLFTFLITGCTANNDALEQMPFNGTCGNEYLAETKNTESSDTDFVTIPADEANNMISESSDVIILDVRRQDEYDEKHIPGSILLPNETIDADSVSEAGLVPEDTILIYCRSGNRSKQAAQKLVDMGFTKVYDFGGINDWPYEVE